MDNNTRDMGVFKDPEILFPIMILFLLLCSLIVIPSLRVRAAFDKWDKKVEEDEKRHEEELIMYKESTKKYEASHKDIINIFENYNDNYTNEVDKDSRKVFINIPDNSTETVNNILNNYTSHVNGEIYSTETRIEYFKNFLGKQVQYTARQYTLLVPQNAKYANDLQKIVDEYLEYLEQKNYD